MNGAKSCYGGLSVMVTGHTGFKGSWLSMALAMMGAKVHGYAKDPLPGSIFEAANVRSVLASHTLADLNDACALRAAFAAAKPDIVFHLAAQAIVLDSYQDPVGTYQTNVIGTLQTLEAAAGAGARAVLCVTSDKCYRNNEWHWPYRETDALGGHDPYSSSKACCEIAAASWAQSFGAKKLVNAATARAGNVIGGGDRSPHRLLPDIFKAAGSLQSPALRNPQSVRPWQHVLEALDGYLLLGQKLLSANPGALPFDSFNFGPDDHCGALSVLEAANLALEALGRPGIEPCSPLAPNACHEAKLLRLDSSKAKAELGFNPAWNARQAIQKAAAWEAAAQGGADMGAFTRNQISERLSRWL